MTFHQLISQQLALPIISDLDALSTNHLVSNEHTLEQVMKTALRCESIGFGFAAGYRSALQALLPELDVTRWAAMCVTEAAGNHPRSIQCTVDESGVLDGEKSFVTMAEFEPQLLVVAKAGEGESTPILKAVLVDSLAKNVEITMMPPLPMVPEVGHGKITFKQAEGKLLEGDGYNHYSKRFRTIEDTHVLMGFTSVLLSIAYRHKLDAAVIEKAILQAASIMQTQSSLNDDDPVFHLHLAAMFENFRNLCAEFESQFEHLPETVTSNWLRDKKLFGVANKARQVRREKALGTLNLI